MQTLPKNPPAEPQGSAEFGGLHPSFQDRLIVSQQRHSLEKMLIFERCIRTFAPSLCMDIVAALTHTHTPLVPILKIIVGGIDFGANTGILLANYLCFGLVPRRY